MSNKKYAYPEDIDPNYSGQIAAYSFETNETYIGKVTSVFYDTRNGTSQISLSEVTLLNGNDEPIDFVPYTTVEIGAGEQVEIIKA